MKRQKRLERKSLREERDKTVREDVGGQKERTMKNMDSTVKCKGLKKKEKKHCFPSFEV